VNIQTNLGSNLKQGDTLGGSYQVLHLIGQGGMGAVYKVHHSFLQKDFALKTIPREDLTQATWERFKQEAKTLGRLDHVNLVKIYDLGMAQGNLPYYVMELLEGESLSDRLKRQGPMDPQEAILIFMQVANGLAYAHERGLVHRDIKPGNIMLTYFKTEGKQPILQVKLLDFGIAKLVKQDPLSKAQPPAGMADTSTMDIFGSPLYMSPEQSTGEGVDHRADIYSLGCSLFETLTGTPPFMGESALITMMKHQKEMPPSLREASLGRQYPQSLEKIVQRLLAKDPDARYQRLEELSRDLSRALKEIVSSSNNQDIDSPLQNFAPQDNPQPTPIADHKATALSSSPAIKKPARTHSYTSSAVEAATRAHPDRLDESDLAEEGPDKKRVILIIAAILGLILIIGLIAAIAMHLLK
jgi:serine/threonine protein kinase